MTTIELRNVSRWYGNVVAVNDITMTIGPGVTGLLGPNGAGKSTLLHLIAGFLPPSRGTLTIGTAAAWRNPEIYRTVGLVPERDSVYAFLTGAEFVRATARLHQLADPQAATRRAIAIVDMADAQERKISTYSKGMKQRIKMAAALVHEPSVLLLDEPFNGMDPRQRLHLMELLRKMGSDGRTVLFSSHILEEVQQVATPEQRVERVVGRIGREGEVPDERAQAQRSEPDARPCRRPHRTKPLQPGRARSEPGEHRAFHLALEYRARMGRLDTHGAGWWAQHLAPRP